MITKDSVKIGLETRFGPDWPGIRCGARTRLIKSVGNYLILKGSSGVEQRTENPRVGGSNPPPGTT